MNYYFITRVIGAILLILYFSYISTPIARYSIKQLLKIDNIVYYNYSIRNYSVQKYIFQIHLIDKIIKK